jgi:hypothetical protein
MGDRAVDLGTLERWMLEVVRHPGTVEDGLADPRAQAALPIAADTLGSFVLPSQQLSALERLGIYSNMYLLRLLEVLEQDFSVLRRFVGDDDFHALCTDFVTRQPSRHYSLGRLGSGFPAFVRDASGLENAAFLFEIATIERDIEEVFDAPRSPAVTPLEWAAFPAESWADARFTLIPATKLHACEYPANVAFQRAIEHGEDGATQRIPEREASYLLIYRREGTVWRSDLEREQYAILEALARGIPLGEVIETVMSGDDDDAAEKIGANLGRWFQHWTANGIFAKVA